MCVLDCVLTKINSKTSALANCDGHFPTSNCWINWSEIILKIMQVIISRRPTTSSLSEQFHIYNAWKFKWKLCYFSTRITPSHWLVQFHQIWSCCYALQAADARLPCGFVALSLTEADWERLINPRAAASLWRPQSGKRKREKNHSLCDINRLLMLII